jgi:hypothetical protein
MSGNSCSAVLCRSSPGFDPFIRLFIGNAADNSQQCREHYYLLVPSSQCQIMNSKNLQPPAVTTYDAVPQAVCIVARSVQAAELSHRPIAKLNSTGKSTTIEILVADQSNTTSIAYVPSTTSSELLFSVWWIQFAQISALWLGTYQLLYICKKTCKSAAPFLSS